MVKRALRAASAAIVMMGAGCGLLAGLEDHQLAPDGGAGSSSSSSSSSGAGAGVGGGPGGLRSLAGGMSLPHALVLDETHVYWVTEGVGERGVWSIPKGGGDPVRLVRLRDPVSNTPTEISIGIAVDQDNVYWTEDNGDDFCVEDPYLRRTDRVRGILKVGGAPFTIWGDCTNGDPHGIAVDGVYVFFSTTRDKDIVRVRKGTLEQKNLASDEYDPYELAIDDGDVFWTLRTDWDGALRTVPKAGQGSGPTDLFHDYQNGARRPNALAVDDTSIYWVDDGDVRKMSKTEGASSIRDLVEGSHLLPAIAIDATHIYWTDANDGKILRVPKGGGDPEVLAEEQNDPEAIAVDDGAIYWTNFARGDLVTLPKPPAP